MEGFKPGEECAKCRGRCCKERGCSLAPEDMLRVLSAENVDIELNNMVADPENADTKSALRKKLLELLQKGKLYTVDQISQNGTPFYFLRMRHKCYTFIGVEAMGECIALTPSGCSLSEDERPKGGRFLKSSPDGHCMQHYTKEEMLEDWKPYQPVLSGIWEEFYPKFEEDGTFDTCDEAYFAWMKEANTQNQS